MSSNEKCQTNEGSSSSVIGFVEKVKKECTTVEETVKKLESYRLNTLDNNVVKDSAQLTALKDKCSAKQGELQSVKLQVSEVQKLIKEFKKKTESLSSRVSLLTNKIVSEKEAQIAKVNETEQHLLELQEAVTKAFTPVKGEQRMASLTEEGCILEEAIAEVQQQIRESEAEFQELGGQLHCVDLQLTGEERNTVLALFEEEARAVERMLETARSKRESLQQDIRRLSEKA
ncbi:uncharacterized protein LOC135366288 [Ornithodoros turicata]|uniref:uncharacterized protein LOC135366288 n=1 Tax=Ornithodoros turicata TaxID=34597 RepID=UPI003138FC11